jgi:uncharacterized 2Fe-2S/4Fe-4S cluster protein (DUF4445 family)
MANRATPRGEITVDGRGRVTGFNRVREGKYTRYEAVEADNGVITLTPLISVTPAELSDLERAREALKAGDAATAAYLLGVPREDVERVAGTAS